MKSICHRELRDVGLDKEFKFMKNKKNLPFESFISKLTAVFE